MKIFHTMAAACLMFAHSAAAQQAIRLKARTLRTFASHPARLGRHYILQFESFPGPHVIQTLSQRGARVLGYVPDNALMVSSEALPSLDGLEVTWAGGLEARDKLSPALWRGGPPAYLVMFHGDVS